MGFRDNPIQDIKNFTILLPGIWDTIHFTFRDMGY